MSDSVQFRHFRYLLAIVEHGGFRAAARHLQTSQANLSVHAKQFQEALGIQLFRRAKKGGIELTTTGVAFRSIAEVVLAARRQAIAALIAIERSSKDPESTLEQRRFTVLDEDMGSAKRARFPSRGRGIRNPRKAT
jgi:DNA-binding transcriptional LysR family regulator